MQTVQGVIFYFFKKTYPTFGIYPVTGTLQPYLKRTQTTPRLGTIICRSLEELPHVGFEL